MVETAPTAKLPFAEPGSPCSQPINHIPPPNQGGLAKSKPRPPRSLIRPLMPHRNLHLERIAAIPQILRDEHSRLLADEQGSAISVAADVVGTD